MRFAFIKNFDHRYSVNDEGQVFSHFDNYGRRRAEPKPLKPSPNRSGYMNVSLYKDKKIKVVAVHILVAEAFHGQRPAGHEVDHIDRDKTNNKANNLRFVTRSENKRNCGVYKNNRTGEKFIYYHGDAKRERPYQVAVTINGIVQQFGYFASIDEAKAKRHEVVIKHGLYL